MKYAIEHGGVGAIWLADSEDVPAGHVLYTGELPQNPIWDDAIQNIREKTQQELDADQAFAIVNEINQEAYTRIIAIVPEHTQRNMTARGLEITQKLVAGDPLTQDEIDERAAIQAVWDQAKAIRAAANTMTSDPLTYADPASRVWP